MEDAREAARELGGGQRSDDAIVKLSLGQGEVVKIGGDAYVKAGERARELVVIFGNAKLDGEVERGVVVVFGNAQVNGPVGRECVVVMGSLQLGPNAKVGRECVVVGGKLDRDPGAQQIVADLEVVELHRRTLLKELLDDTGTLLPSVSDDLHLLVIRDELLELRLG